jgi:hypothetical protein
MTAGKSGVRGFGYQADRSGGYHFEVRQAASGDVTIVERYGASESQGDGYQTAREKACLTAHRWNLIQGAVGADFNQRLQQAKLRPGRWLKSATPLAPHFGKELVLLAWAIDDQDPTTIPRMLANWRGLAPEERWWFYTTINATTRHRAADRPYGWRAAIKIAFLEDPLDIGLESLRITGEAARSAAGENVGRTPRTISLDRAQPERDEGPVQGRLFAEPDEPDYPT